MRVRAAVYVYSIKLGIIGGSYYHYYYYYVSSTGLFSPPISRILFLFRIFATVLGSRARLCTFQRGSVSPMVACRSDLRAGNCS